MGDFKIAVLGAGVVGLTTTLELKKEFRNASIELIADGFYDGTTSFAAAGLFHVIGDKVAETEDIAKKWVYDSYFHWDNMKSSVEASAAGVKKISGYIFASEDPTYVRDIHLEKLSHIHRPVTDEELAMCPGKWKYGCYFDTLLTDPSRYLNWALNKAKSDGVKIQQKKVKAFSDLGNEYNVIVNCTGLGGRVLCCDRKVFPIRGQVAKVEAPWIDNFMFGDFETYIIPGFDSITLGGCRQYMSYSREVSKYDYLSIKERCENLVPSLKNAKFISHRVGLRPHREPIRLEKEYLNIEGKGMKIVHNYGHGGYGVTLAPGTALNAVELVKEVLIEKSSKL
ncbi:hypothetical protein HHI36_019252 [Cryptolaemus montrouzieri]|uniref:FAD dependent oxidoreductase domain-containing protein n=1 Tax=Cryptolaemus montrouzieri TaxID=559131 RepID=A0ABD2P325_9CUCU